MKKENILVIGGSGVGRVRGVTIKDRTLTPSEKDLKKWGEFELSEVTHSMGTPFEDNPNCDLMYTYRNPVGESIVFDTLSESIQMNMNNSFQIYDVYEVIVQRAKELFGKK